MAELLTRRPTPDAAFQVREAAPLFIYLSLLLFLLSLAVYGGLWFINNNLTKSKKELLEQIALKEGELRAEVVEQIFLMEARLRSIRELFSKHTVTSRVFSLLEEVTLPQVRFNNLSIEPALRRVNLSGETVSFLILSKQISELEKHPLISQIEFRGISTSEGKFVEFKVTLTLIPTAIFVR